MVFYAIAIVCFIIYLVSLNSVAFSDWFNGSISSAFRYLLSAVTGWLPFSLGETAVICVPVVAVILVIRAIGLTKGHFDRAVRYLAGLLAVCTVFYSLFVVRR